MKNDREFTCTLDLWSCKEGPRDDAPTTSAGTALSEFVRALKAYGMEVSIERHGQRAKVKICHAEPWKAETARTRNAGRPRTPVTWSAEMGETDRERLAWAESHTVDELQAALGVSKRTAQRRLAELRRIVRG